MKTIRNFLSGLLLCLCCLPATGLTKAAEEKLIALTFDDGPLPGATEALLEQLDALEIKATFFLVGSEMEKFPRQSRAIVKAGHQLGNHTYSHANLAELSLVEAKAEISKACRLLRENGYEKKPFLRPPYGSLSSELEQLLAEQHMQVARWDLLPEKHADMNNPAAIANYVVANALSGSVVLLHPMHDHREQILESLPLISEQLRAKGFRFVTLSELGESSTGEQTGEQPL